VIDKLGASGILFAQLLAADAGETAVISFSDEVKVHQEFTGSPDLVTHSLRMLRKEGNDARMLDAMLQALVMLEQRPPQRRRIIFMIAEKRDRSSKAKAAGGGGASAAAQCRDLLVDLFAIPGAVHGKA